jgi:hypothetical protein
MRGKIMDRRELFGMLGVGAVGLAASGAGAVGAAEMHAHDENIKTIGECAKLCNEAAHHCLGQLRKGGPEAEHHARAHELTMDCQAFCTMTSALAARSSPLAAHAHQACADACRDCAAECEKGQGEIMKECARACRECESMCRRMVKSGGAARAAR